MAEAGARLVDRGGRSWEVGSQADVAWIQKGFRIGLTITSAIPPVFEAYATVVDPWGEEADPLIKRFDRVWGRGRPRTPDGAWLGPEHAALREASNGWQVQKRLVDVLSQHGSQDWWLGYLDTGAGDTVFQHTSSTGLYVGWPYKLVKAGPEQALAWRVVLPELMFPDDHSWCLSTGWDDDWTCLGGPAALIEELRRDPLVRARGQRRSGRDTTRIQGLLTLNTLQPERKPKLRAPRSAASLQVIISRIAAVVAVPVGLFLCLYVDGDAAAPDTFSLGSWTLMLAPPPLSSPSR